MILLEKIGIFKYTYFFSEVNQRKKPRIERVKIQEQEKTVTGLSVKREIMT